MPKSETLPLLDEAWSAFIQGGVSIVAASGSSEKVPMIARATGCRVTADRRKVTLLISSSQAGMLLDAARSTGRIAVVFSQPSTHITIQLKGGDAKLSPVRSGDAALMERYARAFCADLEPLGYAEDLIRALVWCAPEDLAAITFSPDKAFLQTPGPQAGESLRKPA
jgi:hypothetical protein